MRAQHNSLDRRYRSCPGAIDMGEQMRIALDVWDDSPSRVALRLWSDTKEEVLDMYRVTPDDALLAELSGGSRFEVVLSFDEPQIMWYSFQVTSEHGDVWRYGAAQPNKPGVGCFVYGEPAGWQITVYHNERAQQPSWYTSSIVYQIFPDRFNRDAQWEERCREALARPHKGVARVLVDNWNTYPSYTRAADGSVEAWDFYGGSLRGIIDKLDYLESLGIGCLYLNPIFKACSNHRYDTADYMHVDPLLGSDEDFITLCDRAREHGISIMLDGVFNHVGRDSRYFNAYGNYPGLPASHSESLYHDWFDFYEDGSYKSWWGISDLPAIKDGCRGFRELICGENGVVRTWLRRGARAWRLDVVDEISDEFVEDIKRAALAEKPDAVVIGEVWEDASHKHSHGGLRRYFQGKELDATMNYPLRQAIIAYMTRASSADYLAQTIESLQVNYPRDIFYAELNLLSSHDRERILTLLGDAPAKENLSEEDKYRYRLGDAARTLAEKRLWLSALLQMSLPGVPCIYYGDELGMQGYSDPFCRAPFVWEEKNNCVYAAYTAALALRRALSVLTCGDLVVHSFGFDVIGVWRSSEDATMCLLINTHPTLAQAVDIPTTSMLAHVASAADGADGAADTSAAMAVTTATTAAAAQQHCYEWTCEREVSLDGDMIHLEVEPLGARVLYAAKNCDALRCIHPYNEAACAQATTATSADTPTSADTNKDTSQKDA